MPDHVFVGPNSPATGMLYFVCKIQQFFSSYSFSLLNGGDSNFIPSLLSLNGGSEKLIGNSCFASKISIIYQSSLCVLAVLRVLFSSICVCLPSCGKSGRRIHSEAILSIYRFLQLILISLNARQDICQ